MKILLITGQSGCGKTTICEELCKDDRYNYINSYTDRPKRIPDEWGHNFVDSDWMDYLLKRDDVVAKTIIDEKRYCAISDQFDDAKINVYVTDLYGMNDVIEYFPYADIMSILVKRNKDSKSFFIDEAREGRDICVAPREEVDFSIENNDTIESCVKTINVLTNLDLFNKPSHKIVSINDKIEFINKQQRHLIEIKNSLLEQLWYLNYPKYLELVKYVKEKVNDYFDFNIEIKPDTKPYIDEGYLEFNIIGEYTEDIDWSLTNTLVERLSYYSYIFCKENGYKDISYHLSINECYIEECEE